MGVSAIDLTRKLVYLEGYNTVSKTYALYSYSSVNGSQTGSYNLNTRELIHMEFDSVAGVVYAMDARYSIICGWEHI